MRTLSGLLELCRLGVITGFRFRGRYWRWRMDTALGSDRSRWPGARERRRAFVRYGAWARRIRRMSH
ncbi:MAG: hypothetical protein MK085_00180 [Phycisphaerales bacterium]|nr:hypothetical protein [Phycisphaerales bacterium]